MILFRGPVESRKPAGLGGWNIRKAIKGLALRWKIRMDDCGRR